MALLQSSARLKHVNAVWEVDIILYTYTYDYSNANIYKKWSCVPVLCICINEGSKQVFPLYIYALGHFGIRMVRTDANAVLYYMYCIQKQCIHNAKRERTAFVLGYSWASHHDFSSYFEICVFVPLSLSACAY